MDEKRKQRKYQLQKQSLKRRIPIVVLIIIVFVIYLGDESLEFLKWVSVALLVLYIGIGVYFRQKIREEMDKLPCKEKDEPNSE